MQSNHDIFRLSGADDLVIKKIEYLSVWFPGHDWEVRTDVDGQIAQLVSTTLTQQIALKACRFISANDHPINANAYQVNQSRSVKNSYRVVCHLNKLHVLVDPCLYIPENKKLKMQTILVEFLNDVHQPAVRSFSEWRLERGVICCISASLGYPGNSAIHLRSDLNLLRTHFSWKAKNVGFTGGMTELFYKLLTTEDHKHRAVHYLLPLPCLYSVLYPLAETYHREKHAKHIERVTKAALKEVISVSDVLGRIGLFLTRYDAAKLELLNKAGATAAGFEF